jgi:uncharacterized membrane protein
MNLDLSLLGWLHTVACPAALVLGAVNLVQVKGTTRHRRIGQMYLGVIVFASITSLGIYSKNRFFFPHWLAIATICLAGVAYAFAHFKRPRNLWMRGHISSMVLTYYVLIGGGVNEVFLRIDILRRLSGGEFPAPPIRVTHLVLIALTALALVWFNINFSPRRLPRPRPQ